MAIFDDLKRTMLANGLVDHDLQLLAEIAKVKDYYKNGIIFRENDTEDSIYVLLQGKVAIERRILPNQQAFHVHIQNVRRGQLFGEMGFIERRSRSATAVAKGHVRLIQFDIEDLQRLIERHEMFGLRLFRTIAELLSRRLRRMNDQWIRTVESSSMKEFEYF
ncbi:cyclic nucleotide-binding domain-containing protein [candidate division KSB1 bacterium]|nr:cyclic nucleotide-binding domain-containing protein [candidate division KSB1 bacterium]